MDAILFVATVCGTAADISPVPEDDYTLEWDWTFEGNGSFFKTFRTEAEAKSGAAAYLEIEIAKMQNQVARLRR